MPTSRLRCVVAYDGTDFAGWQRQHDARTVQGALESALLAVSGAAAAVVGAGRTDAGVHASGQVAHFDTSWDRTWAGLERALNAALPRDVAVTGVRPAPAAFHARHSAVSRAYRYTVWSGPVRSPLARRTSLHVPAALDERAMAEAGATLVGTHDFGAFGRPADDDRSSVRRLERCTVARDGWWVRFEFEADAFLRHQVRRMVGLLLDIGRGRLAVGAARAALWRSTEAPVARRVAPQGLELVAVRYPPDEELGATAAPRGRPRETGSEG